MGAYSADPEQVCAQRQWLLREIIDFALQLGVEL
jgi:hypothetical protein